MRGLLCLIIRWADTDDSYYTVNINKTAPSTSGTYCITFGCRATYGINNLFASKCGSSDPTSSDWNNGNDIADLGSSAYSTFNSQHWVSINADGGCTFEPGIAMIKVVVNDDDGDGGGGGCFIATGVNGSCMTN